MRITWDNLNKLTIIFALLAAAASVLNFLGAQDSATILLVASVIGLLVFLFVRSEIARRETAKREAKREALIQSVIEFSDQATAAVGRSKKSRRKPIFDVEYRRLVAALDDMLEFLSKNIAVHYGVKCSATCTLIWENKSSNRPPHPTVFMADRNSVRLSDECDVYKAIASIGEILSQNANINSTDFPKHIILNSGDHSLYGSILAHPIGFARGEFENRGSVFGYVVLVSPTVGAFSEEMIPLVRFCSDWCRPLVNEITTIS